MPTDPAPNRPPFAIVVAIFAVIIGVVVLVQLGGQADVESPPEPIRPPRTVTPPPETITCRRAEQPSTDPEETPDTWSTIVVDPYFALPSGYVPSDLTSVTPAGFLGDFEVRSLVIKDLKKLNRAAGEAGVDLGIAAAYRSYADQEELFTERLGLAGRDQTLLGTARPGHSEHQLGTTVDFRSAAAQDVTKSWGSEPEGIWMEANAWMYGFVLSYPRNREDVTCYQYEPWHFRYVGRPIASQVHESGLTLREWLEREHAAGI